MSHSIPFVDHNVEKKVHKAKAENSQAPIKIYARASTITPDCVGLTFLVHNGKLHVPVFVTEEMVGHKFGEFAPTRKHPVHAGDRKTKK